MRRAARAVTGASVEASTRLLKRRPGVGKAFVHATEEGFAFARAHPRQAVADELHDVPALQAAVVLAQMKLTFPRPHTPNTRGEPWGWQFVAGLAAQDRVFSSGSRASRRCWRSTATTPTPTWRPAGQGAMTA